VRDAFAGYSEPIVWLVLTAFFISRALIKTGLGRRIALHFVRLMGNTSLGVAYSLALSDMILATVIPSNAARSGGIIFPITKSLAETYESRPGPSARKIGSYLMVLLYNTDVIVGAMFLTGTASNAVIAQLLKDAFDIELSYRSWLVAALVPGLCSLLVVPALFYRWYPPEIQRTPAAVELAKGELAKLGPFSRDEKLMALVFVFILILWLTMSPQRIEYAVAALIGVAVLMMTKVLDWKELTSEHAAWDVFLWYGGIVQLGKLLGQTDAMEWLANTTSGWVGGWEWGFSLAFIALVYFYAHYAFASITAHATAMLIPFVTVTTAAGTPPYLAALLLAFFSNLCASLTHYGTTPAPVYFGAEYVPQSTWWKLGFYASLINIVIWTSIGIPLWKLLGFY
jgi:DASS family divalent anion:Na+ symporter